jgi:hypothetical protein
MKIVSAILCAGLLAGCNETTKVFDKPLLVDRAELILPPVQPITQNDMKWVVVTPENIQAMSAKGNVVFFALTPKGYQNLSMNVAEMRKYIQQQNAVIAAYKDYYKNEEVKPKKD